MFLNRKIVVCFFVDKFLSKTWFYSNYGWWFNYDEKHWELHKYPVKYNLILDSIEKFLLKKNLIGGHDRHRHWQSWVDTDYKERIRWVLIQKKFREKRYDTADIIGKQNESEAEKEYKALEIVIDGVLKSNPQKVQEYKKLNRLSKILMGQIMKANKNFNPEITNRILMEKLSGESADAG